MLSLVKRFAVGFVMLSCGTLAAAETIVFAPAPPPPPGGPIICPQYVVIAADNFQYDNQDIVVEGCIVLIVDGQHTFASLTLQTDLGGAIVTNSAGSLAGLKLTITGDCVIEAASAIDVSRKGYAGGQGPGAGSTNSCAGGSGGGHGGRGGDNIYGDTGGISYGELTSPVSLGSGGGIACNGDYAGSGGGAIHLSVGGTLLVGGAIRADGGNASGGGNGWAKKSGGGAGGSVWIECGSLQGAGAISANGGNGDVVFSGDGTGGGGGGRVALYASEARSFAGLIQAKGGVGSNSNASAAKDGGAGTVYESVATWPRPRLTVDNGLSSSSTVQKTPLAADSVTGEKPDVEVIGGAILLPSGAHSLESLLVDSGAILTQATGDSTGIHMAISGDCVIRASSSIDLSRKGFAAGAGPGTGAHGCAGGGGGGHGGKGGKSVANAAGGIENDSLAFPILMGSGGGTDCNNTGGRGGGALWLSVDGALIVNGSIRAWGGSGGIGGGGAGGSLWIECTSLLGDGTISANGGAGGVGASSSSGGGGGGGGRIAIYSCDVQLDILNVVALGGASGGGASTAGQPGTIGFFSDRFGDANGDCMVDGADLAILLGSWGSCEGCPVDLNDDGVVDGADLAILLGAWKR